MYEEKTEGTAVENGGFALSLVRLSVSLCYNQLESVTVD